MRLELPKWYDLHAHFRQGPILRDLVADHLAMGCAGILAMPNTQPPVAKVLQDDPLPGRSIEEYAAELKSAGADAFDEVIVPLYLSAQTTPGMIEKGAAAGILRACKYYPPHGTTGSEQAAAFQTFIDNGVFKAMAAAGVILCVHGEKHGMRAEDYFSRQQNAEEAFYRESLPELLDKVPNLRVVGEHVTTRAAAEFIAAAGDTVAATVTPQHLMYTVGHMLRGLKYHLYCMPLVKFEEDRAALRQAVLSPQNRKFFAGTDSAPHVAKMTSCGCAAGCYTGGIAPQLYAEAFEMAGADLSTASGLAAFTRFLCLNGPAFYGLPEPAGAFVLEKQPQQVTVRDMAGGAVVPLPLGMADNTAAPVSIPWRIAG